MSLPCPRGDRPRSTFTAGRPPRHELMGTVRCLPALKENPMADYAIVNLLEIDDSVQGRVRACKGASVASTSAPATSA
jgi:hypothetical protein